MKVSSLSVKETIFRVKIINTVKKISRLLSPTAKLVKIKTGSRYMTKEKPKDFSNRTRRPIASKRHIGISKEEDNYY